MSKVGNIVKKPDSSGSPLKGAQMQIPEPISDQSRSGTLAEPRPLFGNFRVRSKRKQNESQNASLQGRKGARRVANGTFRPSDLPAG